MNTQALLALADNLDTNPNDAEITIEIEQCDMPVRGNAIASDDAELDRKVEDEILERLDRGDTWAWCEIRVCATMRAMGGNVSAVSSWLGGCSYASEKDFREAGDYFEDLKREAIDALRDEINYVVKVGGTGEAFTLGEQRELAQLIHKRFGRDDVAACNAWRRMLQNKCDTHAFMKLVNAGN